MAKSKNKKFDADKARAKNFKKKSVNPFELKVVKSKYETLNTKLRKHQKSQPGQSRVRAQQIRDKTIGVEYARKHKKNIFVDGRINAKKKRGELGIDDDEYMVEKFAMEQRRKMDVKGKRIFNVGAELEDEATLTHGGRNLADIERLESPVGSDDEEDPFAAGNLNEEQTEAMFGGGVFDKKRDHKEIMLDVIAKSKKFKYERQKESEQTKDAFEKLDNDFKDIAKLTGQFVRDDDAKYTDRMDERKDEFSRLMREMKFDARVQPGHRQRSDEEIRVAFLKEQTEKEAERLSRMQDNEEIKEVEDLEENGIEHIAEEKEEVKEVEPLKYSMDDGTLINHREELSEALRNIRKTDSDEEEESEDDESEGEEADEENDGEENTEIVDGKENEESGEEEAEEEEPTIIPAEQIEDEDENSENEEKVEKLPPLTLALEKASTALSSGKSFRKTILSFSNKERVTFLNSMAKKIISGTDKDRPLKLKSLFEYSILAVMRHEVFDEENCSIAPMLYDLATKSTFSGASVAQMLREFANKPISIEFVRLVRVIVSLYSVSDFNHKLGLPCQLIGIRMLSKIRARSIEDIALGLQLSSFLIKSVSKSNNFIPEIYIFLESVLNLCLEPDERSLRIFPSFRLSKLKIDLDEEETRTTLKLDSPTWTSLAAVALQLVSKLTKIKYLASNQDIFNPIKNAIVEIPFDQEIKDRVVKDIEDVCQTKYTSLQQKRKVVALKMLEPKFDKPGDRKNVSKQKRDLDRLKKDLKSEKRAAKAAVIKDAHYIANMKLKEQMAKDTMRNEKTKRIMGQLANQEGDVKGIKKKKYNLFPDI